MQPMKERGCHWRANTKLTELLGLMSDEDVKVVAITFPSAGGGWGGSSDSEHVEKAEIGL